MERHPRESGDLVKGWNVILAKAGILSRDGTSSSRKRGPHQAYRELKHPI
jgi:hypothetical protein